VYEGCEILKGLRIETQILKFLWHHFAEKTRSLPRSRVGRGARRRRPAEHIPPIPDAAPSGRRRLVPGEYVLVEVLPELPPPVGADALPEHGRLRSPAPRPGERGRPERRPVQRAAARAVLVPRRAARRPPKTSAKSRSDLSGGAPAMVALARRLRCSSACGGAASGGARPWRLLGHVVGPWGAALGISHGWRSCSGARPLGRPHRRPGFAYPWHVTSASDGETATCGSAAASARPRKFLRGTRCFGPFGSGHNVLRVTCWAFKGPSSETLITHLSPLYTDTPGAGTAGRPPAACVLRLVPAARGLILVFAIAIRSIRILCFSLVACRCARFLLVLSL